MSSSHRVAQGECLSSIAARYGFLDYRSIYDHPGNAELKKRRPTPNILYPGDTVFIPDKVVREVGCATGKPHRFQTRAPRTRLRIRLTDSEGEAYSGKRYTLTIDDQRFEGETGDDGLVEQVIPCGASSGELVVFLGEGDEIHGYVFPLRLGYLDPPGQVSGVQARLRNLGYECPANGSLDDATEEALRAFQARNNLTESGTLDDATVARLRELHEE